MVILVQEGLENIENYLIDRGYKVIHGGITTKPHDIYIYSSSSYTGLYNEIFNNDMYNSTITNNVLMINANNKSYSEIEDIINSRKYSNLFESEGFF
ncbi:hypothetical protein SH1V18_27810 [Vallitalea longa]|uniref:Uncharacterized protein n=1 Tax=Vallitalea longa TaxID=2936439 RepID=A0A9W6DEL1_9FIRM|nr:YkuS family protein [Vallitalea longa]GKX30301.1 hypothetical protein SH1V18_27810 [Vallitalea longa]